MKTALLLITTIFSLNTYAMDKCVTKMTNAALVEHADQLNRSVRDMFVADFQMGNWTKAGANNTGSAEAIIYTRGKKFGIYAIGAKQIDNTDNCRILAVKKSERTLSEIEAQALKYKMTIQDALHYSEGDYEWSMFYWNKSVSEKMTAAELAEVFGKGEHIEVYEPKEALSVLEDYLDEDSSASPEERMRYENLIDTLKKDFKTIHGVKVGEPDSGGLYLYIFGRRADGKLVGLQTISVET